MTTLPPWLESLENEELAFIKTFVLCSGSLKETAHHYDVTYPTVRLRLDRLIEKIKLTNRVNDDSYIVLIKKLALEDKLDFNTAKLLIETYKTQKEV